MYDRCTRRTLRKLDCLLQFEYKLIYTHHECCHTVNQRRNQRFQSRIWGFKGATSGRRPAANPNQSGVYVEVKLKCLHFGPPEDYHSRPTELDMDRVHPWTGSGRVGSQNFQTCMDRARSGLLCRNKVQLLGILTFCNSLR